MPAMNCCERIVCKSEQPGDNCGPCFCSNGINALEIVHIIIFTGRPLSPEV